MTVEVSFYGWPVGFGSLGAEFDSNLLDNVEQLTRRDQTQASGAFSSRFL